MWNQGLNSEEGLSTLLSYRPPKAKRGNSPALNGEHCHLFLFCPSLCLCSQVLLDIHTRWDRHEKGDLNSGQVWRLLQLQQGKMAASAPWGSQVPAPHSPVCFEEKPASRQSICTTLSSYHSQIPLSGLQRCRMVVPVSSLLLMQTIPLLPPSEPSSPWRPQQWVQISSIGSPICDYLPCCCSCPIILRYVHTKVINPIRNYAGRTQLLITGHSA